MRIKIKYFIPDNSTFQRKQDAYVPKTPQLFNVPVRNTAVK